MSRARLEVFSDAVLAVAITLLALNLTVAGPGHGPLTSLLTHQWQAFAAYLISFFTIGVIWVNHHSLLSSVEVVNRCLLFFNLVLLLFVVLIPVATRLLAEYLPVGGFGAQLAAAVYGLVLEGTSVGFVLMLEWMMRGERTKPPFPPHRRLAGRLRFYLGHLVYLAVIGFSFINPLMAVGLSGVVNIYYIFEQTPFKAKSIAQPENADDG